MKIGSRNWDPFQRQVMMILNPTPDSFYSGSRLTDNDTIKRAIERGIEDGASIFDIGGYSTRPGAAEVSPGDEFTRVAKVMEIIVRQFPGILVSIDTFRSEVARRVIENFGDVVINDISAGERDPEMIPLVADKGVPYIAMHSRGMPQTMASMTDYDNISVQVAEYLAAKIDSLRQAGVEQVIIDPGFGFAKEIAQNYALLGSLHCLTSMGVPVLVGISRKSMIYKLLDKDPKDILAATSALHWECLRQGATILRVHDAGAAHDVIKLYECFLTNMNI